MKQYGNSNIDGVMSSPTVVVGYTISVSGSGQQPNLDAGSYKFPYPIGSFGEGLVVKRNSSNQLYLGFGAVASSTGVFALTDSSTIAVNASSGSLFTVTLGGNRSMGSPINPVNGQKIMFKLKQDSIGSRTITWSPAYQFSSLLPSPTLSTSSNLSDYIEFIYDLFAEKWNCLSIVKGYSAPAPILGPNTNFSKASNSSLLVPILYL